MPKSECRYLLPEEHFLLQGVDFKHIKMVSTVVWGPQLPWAALQERNSTAIDAMLCEGLEHHISRSVQELTTQIVTSICDLEFVALHMDSKM